MARAVAITSHITHHITQAPLLAPPPPREPHGDSRPCVPHVPLGHVWGWRDGGGGVLPALLQLQLMPGGLALRYGTRHVTHSTHSHAHHACTHSNLCCYAWTCPHQGNWPGRVAMHAMSVHAHDCALTLVPSHLCRVTCSAQQQVHPAAGTSPQASTTTWQGASWVCGRWCGAQV